MISKLFLPILIILSLTINLFANDKPKESQEWNKVKATTKEFLDKGKVFADHAFRDAKDEIEELNNSSEVKKLKKDFSSYYDKISKDTNEVIKDIQSSKEAKEIKKKAKEIWTSIFGEKPKD